MDWQQQLETPRNTLPGASDSPSEPADSGDTESVTAPQRLHIRFERKGRGGKTATIIAGFNLDESAMAEIAAQIKKSLGVGGSWRDDEILLQGDCRKAAAEWLRSHSHKVNL